MARRQAPAARLKALILSVGVTFTRAALAHARMVHAKGLQRVYNAPANAPADAPQELVLSDTDGYSSCVAAVAPVPGREPVTVDVLDGRVVLRLPGGTDSGEVEIRYVTTPDYYATLLPSGPARSAGSAASAGSTASSARPAQPTRSPPGGRAPTTTRPSPPGSSTSPWG